MPHFKPKKVGRGWEEEKIKIIVPFRSYPMCNRKFQKKITKNLKKIPLLPHFKPK